MALVPGRTLMPLPAEAEPVSSDEREQPPAPRVRANDVLVFIGENLDRRCPTRRIGRV